MTSSVTDMNSLLKRQDSNEELFKHFESILAVADASERKGGVIAKVLDHHVLPSRVFPEEGSHVVDPVVEDHPPVLPAAMLGHLVQTDQW